MEVSAHSFNDNKRILVSRNAPVVFLVGAAGFIGSHLAEAFLKLGVQVIGMDDFSTGRQHNIRELIKHKTFHFIQENISDPNLIGRLGYLDLPRLDYVFFIADRENPESLYTTGLQNFLNLVSKIKKNNHEKKVPNPRLALVSSIDLYDSDLEYTKKLLKECEVKFAQYVKYYDLNARIIRLGTVYGPRMHFREKDPIVRLIQASLKDELAKEQLEHDYLTRAIYISDAVDLLIKSVLVGASSGKIFDGALIQPIKVAEVKQILLDPLWFEEKKYEPDELPPWPTPNLNKTIKQLNWKPKTYLVNGLRQTISYFKEHDNDVPDIPKKSQPEIVSRWSFSNPEIFDQKNNSELDNKKNIPIIKKPKETKKSYGIKKFISSILIFSVITLGLLYPVGSIVVGGLTLMQHLKSSKDALEEGDFSKAKSEIKQTKIALANSTDVFRTLLVFKRLGFFKEQIQNFEQMNNILQEGVEGVEHAINGSEFLFKTTKIISGEDRSEPKPLYENAEKELSIASEKISKVNARLSDPEFQNNFPEFIRSRIIDLDSKLELYQNIVDKARIAAILMPEITGLNGKKSYLVLLQNNLELRPTGGFIGSYGKFDFEGGILTGIKVDDIYNLDGGLQDIIEPPIELKTDLGIERLFLRDSNFDPDFPTSARLSSFLFKKESGAFINGVIALDLSASGKLLSAVGGLDLPEYGEHVDNENLFEKVISHAETNFFPGSQAKRNYLVSLQTQLFNKVFYLSKQNWPAIIASIGSSLEQKHLMVYVEDPKIFSYLVSANWSGVMPRGVKAKAGESRDFLAINEANLGANKVNYYIKRRLTLDTNISTEGAVMHQLKINYTNTAVSEASPGGKYKNRLRIYLPLGAKIKQASFGETDMTSKLSNFSDYGRSGFSSMLEIFPQETKIFSIDYSLAEPINFKDNKSLYHLDILKQPGTDADSLLWTLNYPKNISVKANNLSSKVESNVISIDTNLLTDRSFEYWFSKTAD